MSLTVSIAICTKDRPEQLRRCLESIRSVRVPAREVIIVDNNSRTPETRLVAESFGSKYLHEPRPGLGAARNRAINNAFGEVLVFTDDDCEVTAGWIPAILQAFEDPEVGCVTGPALTPPGANWVQRELDRDAHHLFTEALAKQAPMEAGRAALSSGIYWRVMLGVGANMAFRRSLLIELGGFPEIFQDSGDDDYIFFKVVQAGRKVKYMPGGVVYRHNLPTVALNVRRFYQYGVGAMRVNWFLSAEFRSLPRFLKNAAWLGGMNLRALFRSLLKGFPVHALFDFSQFLGVLSGFFLPAAARRLWRALSKGQRPPGTGKEETRGVQNRNEPGASEG